MALKRIGAEFEHYKVVEFDKFAINSYNAVHGTDFKVMDIRDIHAEDLEVTNTDKYCYIMTYSFPCTDLSVAGKMKGMKKGSGTRSGLLWEVERLLKEMDERPQVLLMENVPQVHGKKNKEDFQSWISFLESVGYMNYWQDLNAKNYGVAQNRNRCFMISFLGNYSYDFPRPIPLKKKLKAYLEDNVEEKYYINNEKSDKLINRLIDNGTLQKHNFGRQTHVEEFQNNVKIIGQMDNTIDHTFESANRVYDADGVAPTMNTCGDGGLQPKILEVKQLGFMDNGTGKHQSNTVYDENALCPNITTIDGGGTQQIKICTESQIVAMRGRNSDNPSDRTVGNPTEQRLEANMQGTSNCLTSVQKDNLLLENVKIKQATKGGSTECEIGGCFDASYPNSKTRRGRVQDKGNTCPTLTAQNQEVVRIEKVGQISSNGSQCGTVISDNGISTNLVAGTHGYANSHIATKYRIRKLTPRECGRLMGVSDEDIDKMEVVNSNSQLYKQFGNSIVVDVLCAIFKQLNIEQEKEK
jgi:DNA (cytosine-5)-methyltransferase 1